MVLAAAGLIGAACTTPGSAVAPGTPSGDLVLQAVGSGSWSVDCTATNSRGRKAARDINGRGGESHDVIALRSLVSASCTYSAEDAPLTLTLEEEGMACPFGTFADGICRTTLPAGASGTLEFTPA